VHAHGVAAEREERGMAEAEDAAIAPDQVDRQRQDGVADPLADHRDDEVGDVERRVRRQSVEQRDRGEAEKPDHPQHPTPPGGARRLGEGGDRAHDSTKRPRSANSPRGRRWMKRMIAISTKILPRTAPAKGSRNLLTMPISSEPTRVPARLPTPPNTTTMN